MGTVGVNLVALLASLALVFAPHAHATQAHASGQLPARGVFVWGQTIAGIGLGYTQTRVTAVLGKNYRLCDPKDMGELCREPVWFYQYGRGEPLGLAVKFHNGKSVAVFTLGAIQGWKTRDGLKIADPVSAIYSLYQTPIYTKCLGFEALSAKAGKNTTSLYTASGVVYGFALTSPGEKICQ
jgi:hypothetical protein